MSKLGMGKFTKYMFSGGSCLASEDMTFAMVYGRVTSHQCTIAVQSDCFLWLGVDIIEMTAEEAGRTLSTTGHYWWVHWWWSPVPGHNIINYLQQDSGPRYNDNNNL